MTIVAAAAAPRRRREPRPCRRRPPRRAGRNVNPKPRGRVHRGNRLRIPSPASDRQRDRRRTRRTRVGGDAARAHACRCRPARSASRSSSTPPQSGFVNPAYGGRKPASEVVWTPAELIAEELATALPVPNAFLDDSWFPVWPSVRDEISAVVRRHVRRRRAVRDERAGVVPDGGLTAPAWADPVTGATALEALDAALGALEANNVTVDGILGGAEARGRRSARRWSRSWRRPPQPSTTLWGIPVTFTIDVGRRRRGSRLVGGWQAVIVGAPPGRPLRDVSRRRADRRGRRDHRERVPGRLDADAGLPAGRAHGRRKPVGPAGSRSTSLALASVTAGGATSGQGVQGVGSGWLVIARAPADDSPPAPAVPSKA